MAVLGGMDGVDSAGAEGEDALTRRIIALALRVHRTLGPGLLESAYQACLAWELDTAGLAVAREVPLAVRYGAVSLACVYRADLIVAGTAIVEVKAVDHLLPLHAAFNQAAPL